MPDFEESFLCSWLSKSQERRGQCEVAQCARMAEWGLLPLVWRIILPGCVQKCDGQTQRRMQPVVSLGLCDFGLDDETQDFGFVL